MRRPNAAGVQHGDAGARGVQLAAGEHPAHVVTDLSGQRAFVSDSAANLLRVFDLAQRKRIATVATGNFPHGLRLSPDGRSLYVANIDGDLV